MKTPQSPAPVAGRPLTDELIAAGVTAEMLPFRHEVFQNDGKSVGLSATVFAANHKPGDRPFAYFSLDSRDAKRYAKDVAKAAIFVAALNASRPASDQPVEAIGAGREEIARIIRDRAQIGGTDWQRNARGADINAEELADLIAALSPASPARTPMGGEVEALREALRKVDALARSGAAMSAADYSISAERLGEEIYKITTPVLAASSPSPAQGGMAAPPSVQPVEGK